MGKRQKLSLKISVVLPAWQILRFAMTCVYARSGVTRCTVHAQASVRAWGSVVGTERKRENEAQAPLRSVASLLYQAVYSRQGGVEVRRRDHVLYSVIKGMREQFVSTAAWVTYEPYPVPACGAMTASRQTEAWVPVPSPHH